MRNSSITHASSVRITTQLRSHVCCFWEKDEDPLDLDLVLVTEQYPILGYNNDVQKERYSIFACVKIMFLAAL